MELTMVAGRDDVVRIFKNCIDFALSSRSFDQRTEQLRRAGLNAQVIASQSEEMGPILIELIKEINAMALEVGKMLRKISESGHALAGIAVDNTRLAGLMVQYQKAVDRTPDGDSKQLIKNRYQRLNNQIVADFRSILQQLDAYKKSLDELHSTTEFIQPFTNSGRRRCCQSPISSIFSVPIRIRM